MEKIIFLGLDEFKNNPTLFTARLNERYDRMSEEEKKNHFIFVQQNILKASHPASKTEDNLTANSFEDMQLAILIQRKKADLRLPDSIKVKKEKVKKNLSKSVEDLFLLLES